MAQIKNTNLYPKDVEITGNEYVIGTDPNENGNTKNFTLEAISDWITGNTDTIDINNSVRIVNANQQTEANYNIADIVNGGSFQWLAAGTNNRIDKSGNWTLIFKVPVFITVGLSVEIYYDYWLLTNKGKGVIGFGSGVTLNQTGNFLLVSSSKKLTLPATDPSLEPPQVIYISDTDISNPHDVVNDSSETYTTNSDVQDTYFVMEKIPVSTSGTPGNVETKVYRFVGIDGTYGNNGNQTAVLADFVLVDSSVLDDVVSDVDNNSITKVVTVTNQSDTSYNIGNLVNAGEFYWLSPSSDQQINKTGDMTLVFKVPVVVFDDYSITVYNDYWLLINKGKGVIGENSQVTLTTAENFIKIETTKLYSIDGDVMNEPPVVYEIQSTDITDPEVTLNLDPGSYETDSSEYDSYFLFTRIEVGGNVGSGPYSKLYRFIGDDGTYGAGGGDTAESSDFQLVDELTTGGLGGVQSIQEGTNITVDNTDPANPIISSTGATGLEAIDEGNGTGWRLIGRDPADFGNIGENAVDLSEGGDSNAGATGTDSIALGGNNNTASGTGSSVTGGYNHTASGLYSNVLGGNNNTASGIGSSVTGGSNNTVSGDYSFTGGSSNTVSGDYSSALGNAGVASGDYSFTGGLHSRAKAIAEFSIGSYGTDYTTDEDDTDRAFNIGNGISSLSRTDIFTILKNGQTGIGISEFKANTTGELLQVNGDIKADGIVRTAGYTVAGLPAGTTGDTAYVTDADTPTYLSTVVGGGSTVCPVFYDGTNWVCH